MSKLFVDDIQPKTTGGVINVGGQMCQQWHYTTATQQVVGNNTTLLTTWSKSTSLGSYIGSVGDSMEMSSGIWTFPSTGIYKVEFNFTGESDGGARLYTGSNLKATINNFSSEFDIAQNLQGAAANDHRVSSLSAALFNCSNVSTHKIKASCRHIDTAYVIGSTTRIETSIMSSKIGVQNIAHTNGTNAMTVSSGGAIALTSPLPVSSGGTGVTSVSGMVKILDTTITNQADFLLTSSHLNSTYDRYQMFYHFLPSTDSPQLYGYAYVGGSRVTSTNHSIQVFPLDGGAATNNSTIDIFFRLSRYNVGNAAGEGVSGSAILQNVNSTTAPYRISGQNTEIPNTGLPVKNIFGGSAKPAQRADALNGIQFIFSGGNIASGTFQLYGVA